MPADASGNVRLMDDATDGDGRNTGAAGTSGGSGAPSGAPSGVPGGWRAIGDLVAAAGAHDMTEDVAPRFGRHDHGVGIGRPVAVVVLAMFAAYAVVVALVASGAESTWGSWAAGGYGVGAALALWTWRKHPAPALVVALGGALVVPASLLPVNWGATSEVRVVERAASLWLAHGTPYLTPTHLQSWRSYDPYLPGMSLFGLPHAVGLRGAWGDPLLWLAVVTVAALVMAFRVATPGGALRCAGCQWQAWLRTIALVVCPVFALPMALGVTDPPVIALICLGLALTARRARPAPASDGGPGQSPGPERRGHPVLAGLAVGAACALKATAWPALPVILALVVVRDGRRAATAFASTGVGSFLALIAVTAPSLLDHPKAFWQNIVAYPLGLSQRRTQAVSPLPGHLLAGLGSLGHLAAIGLLGAAGLAIAASLVLRPPRTLGQATIRLAIGLVAMIVLAPDTRFGYFAYPLGIVLWLVLVVPHQRGAPAPVGSRRGTLDRLRHPRPVAG